MPLLYMDHLLLDHGTDAHPECPERLRYLYEHLDVTGLASHFERPAVVPATFEQLEMAHHADYIRHVQRFAAAGGGWEGRDTFVSSQSFEAASLAAGTVIDAVDRVMAGPECRAICLVRPPGHHALPKLAMGFCLFNNIALGAIHARQFHSLSRILIVD